MRATWGTERSQPPSAPGTALAHRAFCSWLRLEDLRPRKSCVWRAFFFFFSSFRYCRKGKWIGDFSCTVQPSPSPSPGLCEAVSVTGDVGSQPGQAAAGLGSGAAGPAWGERGSGGPAPTWARLGGTLRPRRDAARSPPEDRPPRRGLATLFSAFLGSWRKQAARSP